MSRRKLILIAPLALIGCFGGSGQFERETPAFFARTIRVALFAGDIDRAVDAGGRALARYPDNVGLLTWNALLAHMRWRDVRSLAYLGQIRDSIKTEDDGYSELLGRIGDMLFRSGSYADSVAFLNAGATGAHGERRQALVELAKELPYSRIEPNELVAELPLLDDALPKLLCTIGERQRPFALDTGASFTALTKSMADELGVAHVRPAGVARDGTGREIRVWIGLLDSFSLGNVQLDANPVLVLEDDALALRDPFGGPPNAPRALVGLDILARFRVTFDPSRRSVLFELPRGLDEPRTVDCVYYDGCCLVPVLVEGRRLWFVLDTGASHSSLTEEGLAALPGASQRAQVSFRRVRTPGGSVTSVREVAGLAMIVSAVRFDGVGLAVVGRSGSGLFPIHGVLGADLVTRCRTTFDRGRLLLEGL